MAMHIKRLVAENIKRIKVVDITPDGSVVQITGANGSGKTSVLDAIYWALAGSKNIDSQPVRKGQEGARIRLELGDVIVTRRFTATGTTLMVEAESGARFPSPQTLLDELLGSLTFDPLAFLRMDPRRQLEQLRQLVKLDVDVELLASENARDFEMRRDLNRMIKSLRNRADALEKTLAVQKMLSFELPEKPVSVNALLDELASISEYNTAIVSQQSQRQRQADTVNQKRAEVGNLRVHAERLRREAQIHESQAAELEAWCDGQQEALAAADPLPEPKDGGEVRARIDAARLVNAQIDEAKAYCELISDLHRYEQEAEQLTLTMDQRTKARADAIARADMPVPGLSFGDGEVMLNDLPLEQASGAEQLRLSIAIAMAGNPKLRVLRIKEGSLLDEHGLALVAEMAKTHDYQVWIERVDTSGKVGIVMEDGTVRGASIPAELTEGIVDDEREEIVL